MKNNKSTYNFSRGPTIMKSNGCSCEFNMPLALKSKTINGEELVHSLPPYSRRSAYLVDEYPACPNNWLRSEGRITSYFVPVEEGNGMWLDFNSNIGHTHHMAIVISVQGINPITGLPCKSANLEQYIDECPKHKIKFGPNRFCEKCNFKWPKQNYICSNGTPEGSFWLDGFRSIDGVVRQYILTAEKMRGVASNIIGKDRVYAIGISFFLSREKKPQSTIVTRDIYHYHDMLYNGYFGSPYKKHFDGEPYEYYTTIINGDNMSVNYCSTQELKHTSEIKCTSLSCCDTIKTSITKKRYTEDTNTPRATSCLREAKTIQNKNLEVGAGAKIRQIVYDDPEKLDFWHDEPEAIICINYCTELDAKDIIEAGKKDIQGTQEGFLENIPMGN